MCPWSIISGNYMESEIRVLIQGTHFPWSFLLKDVCCFFTINIVIDYECIYYFSYNNIKIIYIYIYIYKRVDEDINEVGEDQTPYGL